LWVPTTSPRAIDIRECAKTNWIPTVAGKGWFPFFRFYGPDEPLFQKTWKLLGITKVK
jgi:hypothetical protein